MKLWLVPILPASLLLIRAQHLEIFIVHPMLTLFLMVLILSFNMTNDRKLFQAVKSELKQEIPQYRFTFDNLRKILNKQREMQPDIREDILSCIGLNLMNIDGKIAEHILTRFVESNIPIFAVHDNFIIPIRQDGFLRTCMKEAIEDILSDYQVNTKNIGLGYQH